MTKVASGFDLIIDAVPVKHDINPYLPLLDIDATPCLSDSLDRSWKRPRFPWCSGGAVSRARPSEASPRHTRCRTSAPRQNVLPDVDMIRMDQINEAFERLKRSDVRYRFVIDMASLSAIR